MSLSKAIEYLDRIDALMAIADNESLPPWTRVRALCDLYFMYQSDAHNQAKCVRKIQTISNLQV